LKCAQSIAELSNEKVRLYAIVGKALIAAKERNKPPTPTRQWKRLSPGNDLSLLSKRLGRLLVRVIWITWIYLMIRTLRSANTPQHCSKHLPFMPCPRCNRWLRRFRHSGLAVLSFGPSSLQPPQIQKPFQWRKSFRRDRGFPELLRAMFFCTACL
jgi:hypothetical protein